MYSKTPSRKGSISTPRVFVNRRKGGERRFSSSNTRTAAATADRRSPKRTTERRANRTLADDYYAFVANTGKMQTVCESEIPE